MSNLSEGLIEQGIEQGKFLGTVKNISSLTKHGFTIDQAFEMLEVEDNIKQVVLDKLKEEEDRT